MNNYLRSYQVVMHTVGPVFVGNGKEIGKKEYVFLNSKKVGIPYIQALYNELTKRNKGKEFEEYLLGKDRISLTDWLNRNNIRIDELKTLIKYTLDCGDAIIEKGSNKLQVMEFIKDGYGVPYIPGSSLKGMFRTVLLGADILKFPPKYQKDRAEMRRNSTYDANRNYYLKRDIGNIEKTAFNTLNRPKSKPNDMVNDMMYGFIVSDSEPLSFDNLVLCQRIERHTDGKERRLPLLRECIKPDTEIRFTITVDTSICKLDGELIMKAVELFINNYYENFSSAFADIDRPGDNYVFCGGGCGFVSKTIVYPMYGKDEGIEFTQRVFDKTKVPRVHKHNKDMQYGASPHIIKCTRYMGKTMQMGVCSIEKISAI